MKERVLIVGGSIAGFYTMNEMVKNKFQGTISLIDQKDILPYNPYPLSKEWMMDEGGMEPPYLKDESYYKKHKIDLRLNTRVVSLNWHDKTIKTHKGDIIPYDHLVIATGSKLRRIDLPGDDSRGIFYLRDFNDARMIKEWSRDAQDVVIIGTGFIGLEFASTFRQMGKNVSVLVRSGKPLEKILGGDMAEYFLKMHQSHGINFMFNEETKEFIKDDRGNIRAILTKSGKELKCDMAIIAVGVGPNLSIDYGDSLKVDGGIVVNQYGETSLDKVYAGGDIALWPYRGDLIHIEHWETAWSQGISIAKNILNEKSNAYNIDPYFWTDQYDETFEYLGHAKSWERTLIRGSLDDKKFAVAYLDKDNYPLAILFANKFEKREDVERLLKRRPIIKGEDFTNLDISLDQI